MNNLRFGLCCVFKEQDIKFKTTTVTHILKLERKEALKKISDLCIHNANMLIKALDYCKNNNIGSFRINSSMLPVKTHEKAGYKIEDLPDHKEIVSTFLKAGSFASQNEIRTTFHPDQFVVLNSKSDKTIENSIKDIECHNEIADWVNADVINIHAGGRFDSKESSLKVFSDNFKRLSESAKKKLTLENDDVSYTPQDLIPVCKSLQIPLVYDIHHHKCNPDSFEPEIMTQMAIETWDREPLFHISSPIESYDLPSRRSHHDYIDVNDFPSYWKNLKATVEVEAKAKESAVHKLISDLRTSH
jgi:UV DNA damage endonuclease